MKDKITIEQCKCTMNCLSAYIDRTKLFCVWEKDPKGMEEAKRLETDSLGVEP